MPKTIKFDATNMTIENDGLYKIVNGTKELLAHNNKFKFIDNNKVIINNDGVYKSNPFIDKQITALTDFCNATKCCNISLKYLPGIAKGLAFVCASILGYKAGLCLSKTIIGDNRGNN